MRKELLKLTKKHSTKGERRISEILKRHHIKFKAKARVGKYEVDFLIGNVALEVDGSVHNTSYTRKDIEMTVHGFIPLHITTYAKAEAIEEQLLSLIKGNHRLYVGNR